MYMGMTMIMDMDVDRDMTLMGSCSQHGSERLLLAPLPQVDDLREGGGAKDLVFSTRMLAFVCEGYFRSKNCMRELRRAVAMSKPGTMVCPQSQGVNPRLAK